MYLTEKFHYKPKQIDVDHRNQFYCVVSARAHHWKKVQVGKDQEKAQSEKDSHSKNRGGKKTKLTIRYLYHETYLKPNEQLFSQ